MKVNIETEIHEVIYIEYNDNIPHTVVTIFNVEKAIDGPYMRPVFWDFFADNGDKNDIYAYNSGSGGDAYTIQAPQWVDGYTGEYWISDKAAFKGEVKNGLKLIKPKWIQNFRGRGYNPFNTAEITHSHEYCETCGNDSIDICWDHVFEDENDNYTLKYKDTNDPY